MLTNIPSMASNYDTLIPPPASSQTLRLQRLKDIVAEALEIIGSPDEIIDVAMSMTPSDQEIPEDNLLSFSLSLEADTFARTQYSIPYAHPIQAAYAARSRGLLQGEMSQPHDPQASSLVGAGNSGDDSRIDNEASSLQSPYTNHFQFERQ